MNNDIILFNSNGNDDFLESTTAFLSLNQYVHIEPKNELPEILFITSFPPRECGIATYSQDLINAINSQFKNTFQCTICALESENEQHSYKQSPQYILNTDSRNSFLKTAFHINKNENIKLVVMQHEFGFFEKKEKEFKELFDSITKPIVFVFHTVLSNPNAAIKIKVLDMAAIASSIIVMTNDAANILINEYEIATYKITVIPHGTHLVPPLNREKVKASLSIIRQNGAFYFWFIE
jgi:hypothetical protein